MTTAVEPRKRAQAPDPDAVVLGAIAKTERAEVRITRQVVGGRVCVDIRLWWIPDGQVEFVPSRKGIAVDVKKAKLLAGILADA